ncbi:hypothetical protein [uncultured Corynebacterium sp.]|uniref:hypothetical protein n=1 Tax=uncultured Corynebacterium sp. TaxID=159447 RepID=UPI0025DE48AF|nr:hypothetical protein [uncultured Corynebacterium sp.]
MSDTITSIIQTNSIYLPVNFDRIRRPPRPPEDQQSTYLERFDFHGIFSDVFSCQNTIIAMGPPYLNLRHLLDQSQFIINGSQFIDKESIHFNELNRTSRTVFKLSDNCVADRITLKYGPLNLECAIGDNHYRAFAGRNVLVTMNRDNNFENIVDWLEINAKCNQIDAVIIYDNRSESYTDKDLIKSISKVNGVEVVYVVNWPHPYGPTAHKGQNWDSDFGQHTAWEHARWRFLLEANSVTHCDVDEIPLTEDGSPCWTKAAENENGVFYYRMRDVEPSPTRDLDPSRIRRHSDYIFFHPNKLGSFKYTYIPSKLTCEQQLLVHKVSNTKEDERHLGYSRHFRGLHRLWRAGSQGYTYEESEPNDSFEIDEPLQKAFDMVKNCS